MTERKIYIGSIGPFLYDDESPIEDKDGDFSGLNYQGLVTSGQLYISDPPTDDNHVLRKGDAYIADTSGKVEDNLTADQNLTAGSWQASGVSLSLAAGGWLILAQITVSLAATVSGIVMAKMRNATGTIEASGEIYITADAVTVTNRTFGMINLIGFVSPLTTGTYSVDVWSSQAVRVEAEINHADSPGNNATLMRAIRIY